MRKEINHFSIENLMWARFSTDINYGLHSLPKDIHFTISNNHNSKDINLHLTRNTQNPKTKPSIQIVKINRDLFHAMSNQLALNFANYILQPVDINLYKKRNSNLLFFNTNRLEGDTKLQDKFIQNFKPHTKTTSKRVKITGEWHSTLEEFVLSKIEPLKKEILSTRKPQKYANWAFLNNRDSQLVFKKANNIWYKINTPTSTIDLLKCFVDDELAKKLTRYIMKSIVHLKSANSYEDVKGLNTPYRLIKKPA